MTCANHASKLVGGSHYGLRPKKFQDRVILLVKSEILVPTQENTLLSLRNRSLNLVVDNIKGDWGVMCIRPSVAGKA